MAAPVVHFEINGKNGPELAKFYDELFDWSVQGQEMPGGWYGMIGAGENGIGGGIAQSDPGVTVYIAVPDLDAKLKEVEAAGGKVVHPPMTIPDVVTFALFADPEGNTIGLVKA